MKREKLREIVENSVWRDFYYPFTQCILSRFRIFHTTTRLSIRNTVWNSVYETIRESICGLVENHIRIKVKNEIKKIEITNI